MLNKRIFNRKAPIALLIVGMLSFIWSCSNDTDSMVSPKKDFITSPYDCSEFNYSDTLYFKSSSTTDLIVSTANALTGTFGAFPEGLSIDKNTGEINITESEAGLRYKVFFIPQNMADSCFRYITVSGIDFASGVFNLDNNSLVASPTYKGLSNMLPCSIDNDDSDDDDDGEDEGCEFDDDEDDDDGDGSEDEPEDGQDVTSQGVDIDKITGSINLKNTIKNGALGVNPANGTAKIFRIYYRLNDNSQKALNFIDVRLHYFKNLSDVPQSLLNTVNEKNKEFGAIIDQNSANFRTNGISKRPPDIIIVGRYSF